jgi:hypothetical protein
LLRGVSQLALDVGRAFPGPVGIAVDAALLRVEAYKCGGELQLRRALATREDVLRLALTWNPIGETRDEPEWAERQRQMFVEIHLYFVCWANVYRLMKFAVQSTGLGRDAWSRHHAVLRRATDAREHLEHFEERLPGGRRVPPNPTDLTNMRDERFTLGGHEWELTEAATDDLIRATKAILDGVHEEARALLAGSS